MYSLTKKFISNTSGVAAVEAAIIFPVLLFLFFGMMDLTGYITAHRKVAYAAGQMADLVTQHNGTITKAELESYFTPVNMVLKPVPASAVRIDVFGFRKVGASVNQVWKSGNAAGPSCTRLPTAASMSTLISPTGNSDLVVARVCVTYTPFIGEFFGWSTTGETSFLVERSVINTPRGRAAFNCVLTSGGTTLCS